MSPHSESALQRGRNQDTSLKQRIKGKHAVDSEVNFQTQWPAVALAFAIPARDR